MRLEPPWKNSTFWMVPLASAAGAVRVMFAGALKVAPLAGLVRLTVGATLVKGRSARMWVLPTSALVAAVERFVPLAPAVACGWKPPGIDWPGAVEGFAETRLRSPALRGSVGVARDEHRVRRARRDAGRVVRRGARRGASVFGVDGIGRIHPDRKSVV